LVLYINNITLLVDMVSDLKTESVAWMLLYHFTRPKSIVMYQIMI